MKFQGGVFRAIFDLRPHLVVDIVNFEPFVTRVTDMDATVKETHLSEVRKFTMVHRPKIYMKYLTYTFDIF